MKTRWFWLLWLLLSLALASYLGFAMVSIEPDARLDASVFLPGQTTHGHHQIEMACSACHTDPFGGKEVLQDACMNCHATELKVADDSHPKSKFTDPRNADRLENVDARYCVACHVEHRPEMTNAMGVTLADDYCFHCHADVAEERPTHVDLEFNSCATSGCHNYHDNRALYEDFLVKHMHEPEVLPKAQVRTRDLLAAVEFIAAYPNDRYPVKALNEEALDAPESHAGDAELVGDWLSTAHARAGVNCSACHEVQDPVSKMTRWEERPDQKVCASCHDAEVDGFLAGKHGMRLAQGLSPMTPASAHLPMNPEAHDAELSCTTCHSAHRFDTRRAAVESCLSCHDDTHSRNYEGSPHHALWQKELSGELPQGAGVSCATCHMPRLEHALGEQTRTLVQHNQNDVLRPNEKMIRPVCMSCHGLGFSIDALADLGLIEKNFTGRPSAHVQSLDFAEMEHLKYLEKKAAEAQE